MSLSSLERLAGRDAASGGGVPQAFDLVGLHTNGMSYVAGVGGTQNSGDRTWAKRLERLLSATPATVNVAVGSTRMVDFVGRILGTSNTWVPGTRKLIVVDGTLNDMTVDAPSAKKTAGLVNSLRALLTVYSHGAKIESNHASFTESGTWTTVANASSSAGSCRRTIVQNSYTERTFSGDEPGCLIIHGFDGAGATVEVRVDGELVDTIDTADQMLTSGSGLAFCPIVVPLAGYGSGSHTVRVTKSDAGAGALDVDCFLVPMGTGDAPNGVLVLNGAIPYAAFAAGGGQAELAALNAAAGEVVAEFPTWAVADLTNWVAADNIGADSIHPHDGGYATEADAIVAALRSLAPSNGTVILGTLTVPTAISTPQVSGFSGAPAVGAVNGGAVVASPWAGFGNAISAPKVDFGADVTGMSGAFCLELKIRTAAGSAGVNEHFAGRDSGNVVGGENYRIYTAMEFGIGFVAQWRDAAGVERQILGPAIAANTNYDVALTYDGTTMRLFQNGVSIGVLASTLEAPDATTHFHVGAASSGISATISTIDEVRLSNVARHVANYAPAAAPFVTDGSTVILAHLDAIN